jgi:hypothetical protein
MDSTVWRALLRLIPPNQQDNLLIVTLNKTEFAVQGIIRDVDDFLLIRGRLTGVAEAGGGFFFIPFEQIEYLGFIREVKENEVRTFFSSEQRIAGVGVSSTQPAPVPVVVAAPTLVAPAAHVAPAAQTPEPGPGEETLPAAPVVPAAEADKPKADERPLGAAKAALLERLRARRAAMDPTKPAGSR